MAVSPSGPFPPLLVICGPTATGKTRLSLAVADAIVGAEIISADSRQVYRGMDIGTAKVGSADRARVAHHGLDLVDPDERFSAADFKRTSSDVLCAMVPRGGLAIMVGGTGLYLRAVARGLPLEEGRFTAELRAELEQRLAVDGLEPLVRELRELAPTVAAGSDLANPRRVVRALERVRTYGDRPPEPPRGYPGPVAWVGMDAPVSTHDGWIDRRVKAQFDGGLLAEADSLRAGFDPALPPFSAFGYREAFAVLDGDMTTADAIERDALRTRQFARRQRTWFRAEPGVEWLDAARPNAAVRRAVEVARALNG